MKKFVTHILAIGALGVGVAFFCVTPPRQSCAAEPATTFKEDIVPVLNGHCVSCHQPGSEGFLKGGLDLSSYQGLMKGSKSGPIVIAGKPALSKLVLLSDLMASDEIRMPHGKKPITSCDREIIRSWVEQGAKDN